jgi:hypothetical protein
VLPGLLGSERVFGVVSIKGELLPKERSSEAVR